MADGGVDRLLLGRSLAQCKRPWIRFGSRFELDAGSLGTVSVSREVSTVSLFRVRHRIERAVLEGPFGTAILQSQPRKTP